MKTYAYGFPRLGKNREFKKLIESFWKGDISEESLRGGIEKLEEERLAAYSAQVDRFPIGEMTLYDNMLDTALLFGVYKAENLQEYFELCRGKEALGMTKWFNTNYHYLVPDFSRMSEPNFKVSWNKLQEAKKSSPQGIPYLIGPFTFLKLSKGIRPERFGDFLLSLAQAYQKLIADFEEVHLDEPAFAMELSTEEIELIKIIYQMLGAGKTRLNLFTYYGSVDFLEQLYELSLSGIGLDFVRGPENLEKIKQLGFPEDKTLIAGVVNGRGIWRTDINKAVELVKELSAKAKNLTISNAGPLYHLPLTLQGEDLDERIKNKLAFATERLYELKLIAQGLEKEDAEEIAAWNKELSPDFGRDDKVRQKVKNLKAADFVRSAPFAERKKIQEELLALPFFPTTTIGSFPQTKEVRAARKNFRQGGISLEEYVGFIREKIAEVIKLQEELGLDVFVHGEFERSDMVEFFAQKLKGIATTANGWIISYGTRGYRPPIIYGDVLRPAPMTIDEIGYAQSLTEKPVKGMLTGPVTIIAWSFVREDIPLPEVAYQIALALQEEVADYQKNGIRVVQIDEPAFREKAPLKKKDWEEYFTWATKAYILASRCPASVQIHMHMCYSDFEGILDKIIQADFDVLSIENARSGGELVKSFAGLSQGRGIGLGVWDIHSPAVPTQENMEKLIQEAAQVLPRESLWVNPDCGLKTRNWPEVTESLKNMVAAAEKLRG